MKKGIWAVAAISIIAVALFGTGISTIPIANAENAAAVIKDFGCNLFGHFSTDGPTHSVTNKNMSKLVCHFENHPLASDKVQKFEGFACNTVAGLTTNTQAIITPSGQATLICIVNL